jgi:hypothetical protein
MPKPTASAASHASVSRQESPIVTIHSIRLKLSKLTHVQKRPPNDSHRRPITNPRLMEKINEFCWIGNDMP